ncbi:ligand-binding sensor domain-containing protein [Algoriphagus mannitolivorans]|uniref:ligand-binding sensor domain-containing protein n=1 Tax=Algoriphagus mannitolivorans TaxID=226504 RepID=UPI00040646C5|nr:two-component regulator propeller domain-containing protein [Algoriphagus mannitolivorans]
MVESWDNTNGLPQNVVFAMDKDNHGYLWLATEEGLARLDGASWRVFDQDNYPFMPEQTYYAFHKSSAGIWASADRSIVLLDKTILKTIDCTKITDNTWIRAVTEIGTENLLIGTDDGKIHEWNKGSLNPLDFWKPEFQLEINSFYNLSASKVLVGTSRGLYELDMVSRKMKLVSSDTFSANKIFGNPNELYIYSSESGISILRKDYSMEKVVDWEEIKDLNLSSLTVDSENRIWSGSLEKGLIAIEKGKVQRFNFPELKNYSVRKIIKEDNNLFLGTMGKGLLLIKPAKVNQLNFEQLVQKNIKAIYQSEDSSVWIGTKADGLFRIKNGEIKSWNQQDGLIQNSNTTISSHNGKIYFGSNTGISVLDMKSGKILDQITEEDGLRSNYVHALYKDSKNILWILTRKGGIHYLDSEGKLHQVKLDPEYEYTRFVSALELSNKQILIGSMNQGLIWVENGKLVKKLALPLPPGENVVYSIYQDKEGDLWLATHGGVLLLKDGKFKALKKIHGLKSKTVYSITGDGKQGIWISSNFGVQYFSTKELENFKKQEGDLLFSSTLYDKHLGLPNSETNGLIFPAAIQDFSGKIWVPTVEGVGIIDPVTIVEKPKNPINFTWDELRIGEEKSSIGKSVEIPQGVRMFQISFSLIDLENPTQYTLFYRIAGNNEAWLPIKDQRQLYFNGLKPGDYTLEVKILRFGQDEKIYALPIKVSATFFESLSFKLILGFAFILLLYFLLLLYFNRKMKKELEEKVVQRTLELSQTNSKLKSALTEIEVQNAVMKELTWNHSHLLRAPLTRAMGISQLLINFSKYKQAEKTKEELEIELLNALKQVDEIVKDTHAKTQNFKK